MTTTEAKLTNAEKIRKAADWLAANTPDLDASVSPHAYYAKHDGPQVNFYGSDFLKFREAFAGKKATCRREDHSLRYTLIVDGILFTATEYKPRDPDRSEWEVTL